MLKSILSVFASLGLLVTRIMLIVGALACAIIFVIVALTNSGDKLAMVLWLLAALACVAVFMAVSHHREREDEKPVKDEWTYN